METQYQKIGGIKATICGEIKNPSFIKKTREAYESLPSLLKDFCESSSDNTEGQPRLKIVLGDKMSSTGLYETSTLEPTIDDPRIHIDEVLGCYNKKRKQVTINALELKINPDKDIQEQNDYLCGSLYWHDAFRHELGHFFSDTYCNAPIKRRLTEAWNEDVIKAGGIESLREKGYGYYVQDRKIIENPDRPDLALTIRGEAGREEVFAEAFAHYHGGGIRKELHTIFPASFKQVRKTITKFYNTARNEQITDSSNQRTRHYSLSV